MSDRCIVIALRSVQSDSPSSSLFSSIMLLFQIRILELLNKLKNHILLFLRLKLYPEEIKLLFFKLQLLFIVKYLAYNFSEYFEVSKLKFELIVFELFNFVN